MEFKKDLELIKKYPDLVKDLKNLEDQIVKIEELFKRYRDKDKQELLNSLDPDSETLPDDLLQLSELLTLVNKSEFLIR